MAINSIFATNASNGAGLFAGYAGDSINKTLVFKSIKAGNGISISSGDSGNDITISQSGPVSQLLGLTVTGDMAGVITYNPNTNAGTLSLSLNPTGVAAGTYNNITVNSHGMITAIRQISLQDVNFAGMATLESPVFTGNVVLPANTSGTTRASTDNSNYIATTAYYVSNASTVNPLMDGVVSVGTSTHFARQDHVHPTDTSLLPKSGGTMSGLLTANAGISATTISSPLINGTYYVTGLPTDGVTDCYSILQTAINAAVVGKYSKLVIPPGTYALNTGLTIPGPVSWSLANNITLNIEGSGIDVTVLYAKASMTTLVWKDGNYNDRGGLSNLTLDGRNKATNVFWHQLGTNYVYEKLKLVNAAVSGTVLKIGTPTVASGGCTFDKIEVKGIDPNIYVLANMPSYGVSINMTDGVFSNMLVWNASIACWQETTNCGGNRAWGIHTFGYGTVPSLAAWRPQYGFLLAGFLATYSGCSCDGASIASVDISTYTVGFFGGFFQWDGGSLGSAVGIRISSGAGDLTIQGNAFTNVTAANAIVATATPGGSNQIFANSHATFTMGAFDVNSSGMDFGPNSSTFTGLGLNGAASSTRSIRFLTTGTLTTTIGIQGNQTGSNAGADLYFDAYDDAGAYLRHSLIITRSNGAATFSGSLSAASLLSNGTVTGTGFASSNNYSVYGTSNGPAAAFYVASGTAVNFVGFTGTTANNPVIIAATGADTNIDLNLFGKGTGIIKLGANTTMSGTVTAPNVNGVYYVTGLPTDGVTDCSALIQAAVTAATTRGASKLVFPAGTFVCNTGITQVGNVSWSVAGNIALNIYGAGKGITVIKAGATMSCLWHKDNKYCERGGIHDITFDGNNVASTVLWYEYGNHWLFSNVLVKNAAAGGTTFQCGSPTQVIGESMFDNIEVVGIDTSVFTSLAQRPNYGLYVYASDCHFTNIIATNAVIATVYEHGNSGGNKWDRVHPYGFNEPNLVSWAPQYGAVACGGAGKWDQFSGDGALIACMDVIGYDICVINSHFGWATDQITGGFTTGQFNLSVAATTGATTLTSYTTYGMLVGQYLSGPGIAGGTTVTAINTSTNVITLSAAITSNLAIGAQIAVGATAQASTAVGLRFSSGSGNCTAVGNTFTNVTSLNAITSNSSYNNIIHSNQGATYTSGIVYFDNLVSTNTNPTINTPNGYAASFYAAPNSTDCITLNASATNSSDVTIAVSGTSPLKNILLYPTGAGTVKMSTFTASGLATLSGGISSTFAGFSGKVTANIFATTSTDLVLQTSVGTVAEFYTPAGTVDHFAFNASAAAAQNIQIAINGTTANKGFQFTPNGSGTVTMPTVTVAGLATVGGISSSGDIVTTGNLVGATVGTAGTDLGVTTVNGYVAEFYAPTGTVDHFAFNASAAAATDIQIAINGPTVNKSISLTPKGNGSIKVIGPLTISGGTTTNTLVVSPGAPASSSSTGITGQITSDTNYLYVCTATNTWKRVALTTF